MRRFHGRGRREDGLWRNHDFLKLWSGETVSLVGSQVTDLALPLAAILTLRASAGQVGILRAAEFTPYLLVTLFAGAWLDRRRRRPVLIATDLARALLLALIPAAAVVGFLRIELLYVIAFAGGICTVVFSLAYQSYVPALVERAQLVEANSKLQVSASTAAVGGAGLAGILVSVLTAPFALIVDAVSFLASALGLLLIRKREAEPAPRQSVGVWREIGQGVGLVFGNPSLRGLACWAATVNLFYVAIETIILLYATRELAIRPALLAFIIASASVGALVGSLLASWAQRRFAFGFALCASYLLACLPSLLIPLARGSLATVSVLFGASFVLTGMGMAMSQVYVISLRQAMTPTHLFGRMNATYRFVVSGAVPLGALLAGYLGETLGLRGTLTVAALGLISALVWVLFSPLPRLRTLPEPAAPVGSGDLESRPTLETV
jgi:MFS family permease